MKIINRKRDLKLKPHAERNLNFDERVDLNLFYEHELTAADYTYKDALEVYLSREGNYGGQLSANIKNKEKRKEYVKQCAELFEVLNEKGSLDACKELPLYKKAKLNLDKDLSHPDVDKSIPKEYWDKFSNFLGITPSVLHHPHFYHAFEVELAELEKCKLAENLVVVHCARKKPYSEAHMYKFYTKISMDFRDFDVCVLSLYPTMLTPIDFSPRYPHICYDWHHLESPQMQYHYETHNLRMLAYLVRRLKYKNVIVIEAEHFKHLHLLKDYYGVDYISFIEAADGMYFRYLKYLFSNKSFNEKGEPVFCGSFYKLRVLANSITWSFLCDLFGDKMKQYFKGKPLVTNISKEALNYIKWDEKKRVKPLVKNFDITDF